MSNVSISRCCTLLGWKHFTKTRLVAAQNTKLHQCHGLSDTENHVPSSSDVRTKNNILNGTTILSGNINYQRLTRVTITPTTFIVTRTYTKHTNDLAPLRGQDEEKEKEPKDEEPKKIGLFKRFKQMYRDYWYVLIPVHVATSTCWAGLFYYTAKSGVDVIAVLETMKVSASLIDNVRDSNMGYIALTYALYKIATPARYAVTLAGTTISINYLKRWGYLKPVPSREKLRDMYQEKKGVLQEKYLERKDGIQEIYHAKRQVLKDKKRNLWEDIVKRSQSKQD